MKRDFEEIYGNLCEDTSVKISNPIKKNGIYFVLLICATATYAKLLGKVQNIELVGILVLILWFLFMISIVKGQDKYIKEYKEKIIGRIVNEYNDVFSYNMSFNIGVENYRLSELSEKVDVFKSRDGIYGEISDDAFLDMAYINTDKKHQVVVDGKPKTELINTFYGLFGAIKVKNNINGTIVIKSNDFKKNYDINRIELESSEFEKRFDCFAKNKIVALQIFTFDTIEKINELYNMIKAPMEICVKNDTIYFRILIKDVFNPPRFSNPLDRNRLRMIYNIVDFANELGESLSEKMVEVG